MAAGKDRGTETKEKIIIKEAVLNCLFFYG